MGILDDAIREHLELKRQHGAPEDEVQRQQDEALGPARRDVAPPAEDGERTVASNGELEDAQLDEADPQTDEAAPVENEAAPVEAAPEPLEAEPAPTGDTPPRGFASAPEEEPALEELPHEAADDPFGGDEPFADEDDEGQPDGDEDDEDGDVLEDTPDFLQETPEHDRLWFEQKPPRDFDFD